MASGLERYVSDNALRLFGLADRIYSLRSMAPVYQTLQTPTISFQNYFRRCHGNINTNPRQKAHGNKPRRMRKHCGHRNSVFSWRTKANETILPF
ncbi:hypothetical protein BDN70DRAFT_462375 [Pholiota conissans]|uniref:Uncharacterized protein n=1 Tax=Pholiota conissans TaxID=109636 RepID=A0A9P6D7J1_9AGAR|nr:hypothetical protein BDN70DRAFT_462375 [Pholiota conissans]